ncbi:hypothetical protein, partial [Thiocapsa sp.]|uniref:hypothetical protein n=1 Tax=Thiocapsa sp. TaxID=2024551 RepID=UPI002C531D31
GCAFAAVDGPTSASPIRPIRASWSVDGLGFAGVMMFPRAVASLKPRSVRNASFVGVVWPRQLRRLSELAQFKVFKNIQF